MVIPVHDVNPVRRTPWVTHLLIAANVVVFLRTPGAATLNGSVRPGRAVPPAGVLRPVGGHPARAGDQSRPHPGAERARRDRPAGRGCLLTAPGYLKIPVLSAVTAMFLHGSWLHLLGNMLFLWIFGNNIEDRFGHLRYILFYLVCGLIASYGFALVNANSTETLIGASGAIAGVLGAYLVLYPRARVWSLVPFLFFIPLRLPAWFVLGLWFVLQWAYSAGYAVSGAGSVAYLAHVFGFLTGLLIGALARNQRRPLPRY